MAKPYLTKISEAPVRPLQRDRGRSIRLVDPELAGSKHVDVHLNELRVDGKAGPTHYHERSENIYVILEGTIAVEIEGQRHLLGPNDVAYIPPGLRHAVSNGGKSIARVLEIYAPPGPDFHSVDDNGAPAGSHGDGVRE